MELQRLFCRREDQFEFKTRNLMYVSKILPLFLIGNRVCPFCKISEKIGDFYEVNLIFCSFCHSNTAYGHTDSSLAQGR
jgi:hypothetical protein